MSINTETLNQCINKFYWYNIYNKIDIKKLSILVYAKESKYSYGKIRILITPLLGNGSMWVNKENLTEESNPEVFVNSILLNYNF